MRTSILWGGVSALVAIFTLSTPANGVAAAPPEYTVTDLGTLPGGVSSDATGINASGQVAGFSLTNGELDAFLYTNGKMIDLGVGQAYGVNASGQVVGIANQQAFLYSSGGGTILTPFGTGQANGINDSGQIVGGAWSGYGFVYSNGIAAKLEPVGSTASEANAINNSGQIVGWARGSPSGNDIAFLYGRGVYTPISLPSPYNSSSDATGINASGQVIGYAYEWHLVKHKSAP